MSIGALILLIHAGATLAMAGLIWFVQIAHYPLFSRVGLQSFPMYSSLHQRLTTVVVGPLMLAEAFSAIWLVLKPPPNAAPGLTVIGLGLLAIVWISTAALQVPCHRRLERGFDALVARRLVRTNWVRTIAWTGRAAIALALLAPGSAA